MDAKPSSPAHEEKVESNGSVDMQNAKADTQNLKLDKHGYALSPQPSDNKDDPLVLQPPMDISIQC